MTKPLFVVAAIAIALLIAGVSPPLLLVLVCPVMMVFMMRGMDHNKEKMDHNKEK